MAAGNSHPRSSYFLIHLRIMKITLAINLEVLGIDLIIFGKNIIKQFEISLALYVNRQG